MNVGSHGYYGQPLYAFVGLDPVGTNWVLFGGVVIAEPEDIYDPELQEFHTLRAYSDQDSAQSVIIRFDLSTVDPTARLNQIAQSSFFFNGGFPTTDYYVHEGGAFFMNTRVLSEGQEVASAYFESSEDYAANTRAIADFEPLKHVTVETQIWTEGGVGISSFPLDFNVIQVPEPFSALLLAVGLALMGPVVGARRKRALLRARII